MRQLQVVLTIIWLVNCVGCGSSNQSAPTLNEMQAAVQTAADEEMISLVGNRSLEAAGRSWRQDIPLTGVVFDPNKVYLATLAFTDGQEMPVKVKTDGQIVTVLMSQTQLPDGMFPTGIKVYQFALTLDTEPKTELVYQAPVSRSSQDEKPIAFIVHGFWSNTEKMALIDKMFKQQTVGNNTSLRNLVSEAHLFEFNDFREISYNSNKLWNDIHNKVSGDTHKRIIIVAHSMGGLISRHAIEERGMSHDIKHLIMLGTPNQGTSIMGLTGNGLVLVGLTTGHYWLSFFAFTIKEAIVPALGDLASDSSFIKSLNRPSHTDSHYYTIAGTLDRFGNPNSHSDGLVSVESCNWTGLSDESYWHGGAKLPLSHTDLPVHHDALMNVYRILSNAYPEVTSNPGESNNNGGSEDVQSGSSSQPSSTQPSSPRPSSPTTTTTQVTLAHPASRWDYGENGFWYREGKWHAAAKRVDVGAPIEPVQMDGRDGRIKSGVSQRGFSYQRCQNGLLVNLGTDVVGIKGEFYNHYREVGGPQGELGCITTEQQYDQRSGVSGRGGEWAQFEGGFITKFDGFTAKVLGDFARVWNDKGKGQGELGYPKDQRRAVKSGAPQFVNTDGGWGQYQPFEGGCIAEWSQTEHVITGGFNREYLRTGGPGGPLGYPQTAKRTGVRSGCSARQGEEQIFQFGRICELGVNNAWAVYGEILKRYSGPEYGHGFPLGPSENDNHRQRFEGTVINW